MFLHHGGPREDAGPGAEDTGQPGIHLHEDQQRSRTECSRVGVQAGLELLHRPFFKSRVKGSVGVVLERRGETEIARGSSQQVSHGEQAGVKISVANGGNSKKVRFHPGNAEVPRLIQAGRGKEKPVPGLLADPLCHFFTSVRGRGDHPDHRATEIPVLLQGAGVVSQLAGALVGGDQDGDIPAAAGGGRLVWHEAQGFLASEETE